MSGETAMTTDEASLALAISAVDGSARRTLLRRVRGIDFDKSPATLFQFICELGFKSTPALLEYASVQAALTFAIAFARHCRSVQILDANSPEPPSNPQALLVLPVASDTCHLGCHPSNSLTLSQVTNRPAVYGTPSYGPLQEFVGVTVVPDGSGGQAIASDGDAFLRILFAYPIDLLSLDLTLFHDEASHITISGSSSTGAAHEEIAYDDQNTTLSFGPDWTGLTSLGVVLRSDDPLKYSEFKIDNLAYNNSDVPEPASWAMMLLGFLTIGLSTKYRRHSTRGKTQPQ